jgi:hypothetical protein
MLRDGAKLSVCTLRTPPLTPHVLPRAQQVMAAAAEQQARALEEARQQWEDELLNEE